MCWCSDWIPYRISRDRLKLHIYYTYEGRINLPNMAYIKQVPHMHLGISDVSYKQHDFESYRVYDFGLAQFELRFLLYTHNWL